MNPFDKVLSEMIKNYRCRLCKTKLTNDNFGGLGPNHMIGCIDCKKNYPEYFKYE